MRALMEFRNMVVATALLITAGCTAQPIEPAKTSDEIGGVSDAVAARAAPGQDLSSARVVPEDGCYWYEHRGPVETTLVPLRTVGGAPLCTASRS